MRNYKFYKYKKFLTPYLFLLPGLIMLSLYFFWPIINTFRLVFYRYTILSPPQFTGMANINRLISDAHYWNALKNTVVYSLIVVPSLIVIPLIFAGLLNQKLKFIQLYRVGYYLPRVMSLVVVGVIWKYIYQSDGLINMVLKILGLSPIGWLSDPSLALVSVSIVTIWVATPYYMIIYLAGLQTIPKTLIEAAKIDGAGYFQQVWHVILPLLKHCILTVTLVSTVNAMRVFGEVYIITEGGPGGATDVLTHYIYRTAFSRMQMGYASVIAATLLLLLLIISIMYIKLFTGREKRA